VLACLLSTLLAQTVAPINKQVVHEVTIPIAEKVKKQPKLKTERSVEVERQKQKQEKPKPKKTQVKRVAAKPVTGNKVTWMNQAGIPVSQHQYVDYIIHKESSWNPKAINPNGGACGLPQSLPCSKLGQNWHDPVVALKWADTYAIARYGSWASAYSFWTANNWW